MKRFCVVPCCTKIWDKYPEAVPTPASEVYIGDFLENVRICQKNYSESWNTFSKIWVLSPSDIVEGPIM